MHYNLCSRVDLIVGGVNVVLNSILCLVRHAVLQWFVVVLVKLSVSLLASRVTVQTVITVTCLVASYCHLLLVDLLPVVTILYLV